MKQLHILNGDSTAYSFKETGLEGDKLVWREILSEGPVIEDSPEEFWKVREQYIEDTFGSEGTYKPKVLYEVSKLNYYRDYSEIILWFEFDLFCQVNLIYILNWFSHKEPGEITFSLICPAEYPGIDDFRGLGQLTPEQLKTLFPARVKLNKNDLLFAAKAWKAYTSENPFDIQNLLGESFGSLPLLKPALEAHLRRFPSVYNGLNRIENELLNIINQDASTQNEIIREYFKRESVKIFGIGDLQVITYLQRLITTGIITLNGKAALTKKGRSLMQGSSNMVKHKTWRWDEERNEIVLR